MPDLREKFSCSFVRWPADSAVAFVRLYQLTLSPALAVINPGCGCRFTPTCSHYALGAFHEHGLLAGSALTLRRLAKCAPWHAGGLDPVPPRKFSCVRSQPVGAQSRCVLESDRLPDGRSKTAPLLS